MADSENTRTLSTRRRFLTTAATVTLAPAAALAAVPLDADMTGSLVAADDAELLALVAAFYDLEREHERVVTEWRQAREEAEKTAPPEPDDDDDLDTTREKNMARSRYINTAGGHDLYETVCRAGNAAGMTLREVFKTPARTPAGILAKVELYRLAYGSDPQGDNARGEVQGNADLDAYDVDYWTDYDDVDEDGEAATVDDPDWRPWLDTIVADLRTLAGEVRT